MIKQEHFCRNCIVPDGFLGLSLNEEGLCNFCRNPNHKNDNWYKVQINDQNRERMQEDWKQVIENLQKMDRKRNYHCVLGYSGGKDSTALLDYLLNELQLNVLVVTVNTGFMTDIAKQNIIDTVTKMNIEDHHLFIEDVSKTFTRLYRWLFFNHQSNTISLTVDVCDQCSDLIHSIVVKQALNRNIPYVFFGYSPDQIKRYFYEIPQIEALNDWKPIFIDLAPFTEKDQANYINNSQFSTSNMPRILLPYHVMKYDEKKIIETVEKKGYIQKGKADPILTNCHVVKAAAIYDLYRYGGLTYALQYAELVRQTLDEKTRRLHRKKWLRLYKGITHSICKGKFNVEGTNNFLKTIGTTMEEIMDTIIQFRNLDPNKNKILQNISLLNPKK